MDQNPAQPSDSQSPEVPQDTVPVVEQIPSSEAPPSDPSQQPPPEFPSDAHPLKKFLPFIVGGLLLLIVVLGAVLLFAGSSSKKASNATPTPRPSATPIRQPTVVLATPTAIASAAATIAPAQSGRLSFIKDGDIYNSDFSAVNLFIKTTSPAGNKLSWSSSGKFLSWIPKGMSSLLEVYNREQKKSSSLSIGTGTSASLTGYSWSPTSDKLITLSNASGTYSLDLYEPASNSAVVKNILKRGILTSQIEWVKEDTFLMKGADGISSVALASPSAKLLVANPQVLSMTVSSDKTKVVYSVGNDQKSDVYTMGIDGSGQKMLTSKPASVNMGTTNLPATTLDKGFLPVALWFPKTAKLLVAYHYFSNLPLVGIYDLSVNSVQIIGPFALQNDDFMVDDLRLLGVRPNPLEAGTQQLTLYTLENNAKLNVVRVIPGASSPAFFDK